MKVGAFVPVGTLNATPEFARALGPTLEERNFESLWVAEHVVLFDDYASKYPYDDSGRFPGAGDSGLLEPWTALSYVAATTTSLPALRPMPTSRSPSASLRWHWARAAARVMRTCPRSGTKTTRARSASCAPFSSPPRWPALLRRGPP